MGYFTAMAEERRQHPQDDLLSGLVAAEEEGDRLTADELVTNCILLLIAGHETTVNLIGNGTLALLRNPDRVGALGERSLAGQDRGRRAAALRQPGHLTVRVSRWRTSAAGETEVKAEGPLTRSAPGSANRDPAQFADPRRLDIAARGQPPPRVQHRAVHYCLGATLARVEGQIALLALSPGSRAES